MISVGTMRRANRRPPILQRGVCWGCRSSANGNFACGVLRHAFVGKFLVWSRQVLGRFLAGSWHGFLRFEKSRKVLENTQNDEQMMNNHEKWGSEDPKCTTNLLDWCLGRFVRPLACQLSPETEKGERQTKKFSAFLRNNKILGAILGPSGFWRGSPNYVFGHHVGKKQEKKGPGAVP